MLPVRINVMYLNRLLPEYYKDWTKWNAMEYLRLLLAFHTVNISTTMKLDLRGRTTFTLAPTICMQKQPNIRDVCIQPNYRGLRVLVNKTNLKASEYSYTLTNTHGHRIRLRCLMKQLGAIASAYTCHLYEIFRSWPLFCGEFIIVLYREKNTERKAETNTNESATIRFILLDLFMWDDQNLLAKFTYGERLKLMAKQELVNTLEKPLIDVKIRTKVNVRRIGIIRRPQTEIIVVPELNGDEDIVNLYNKYVENVENRKEIYFDGIIYRDKAVRIQEFLMKKKFAITRYIVLKDGNISETTIKPNQYELVNEILWKSNTKYYGNFVLFRNRKRLGLAIFDSYGYRSILYLTRNPEVSDNYLRAFRFSNFNVHVDGILCPWMIVKVYFNCITSRGIDDIQSMEICPERSLLDTVSWEFLEKQQ